MNLREEIELILHSQAPIEETECEKIIDQILSLFSSSHKELIETVEGMKRNQVSTSWVCPKDKEYGKENGYCELDGKKLIKEERYWENDYDQAYNHALSSVLAKLKGEGK